FLTNRLSSNPPQRSTAPTISSNCTRQQHPNDGGDFNSIVATTPANSGSHSTSTTHNQRQQWLPAHLIIDFNHRFHFPTLC
ncbi:hypothetical protein S245_063065, partial [Arachis hypogaea]